MILPSLFEVKGDNLQCRRSLSCGLHGADKASPVENIVWFARIGNEDWKNS